MSEGRLHADLVIDAKKNRLRIYKTTLHELGDPKYIQLLVDPDQRNLVIVAVDRKRSGDQTVLIGNSINKPGSSCEIYSGVFIGKLCEITIGMEPGHTYRLKGEIIPSQGIASFNLDMFEMIQQKGEQDGA